jgi:hypothetical protein
MRRIPAIGRADRVGRSVGDCPDLVASGNDKLESGRSARPPPQEISVTSARAVPAHPTVAVVALCFGGLTAALTQTMVIPIPSELPQLLSTSPSNARWVTVSEPEPEAAAELA